MPWFVWLGVGVFCLLLVPATILVARAGFRLLRAAGSLGRELEPRAARLQAQQEEMNRLSERATFGSEAAKGRIEMLRISLERIEVFTWALEDVRPYQSALRWLVLRK